MKLTVKMYKKILILVCVFAVITQVCTAPVHHRHQNNKKNAHKKICPSKRQIKEVDFDGELVSNSEVIDEIDTLCGDPEGELGDDQLAQMMEGLRVHIDQALLLNITQHYSKHTPHLARSCNIATLSTKSRRKVNKCFGLNTFPKIHNAKRLMRLKPQKAAQLLLDQLITAYQYWGYVHQRTIETSKVVWNDETLQLEEKVGSEIHLALGKAIYFVNGHSNVAKKSKCDSKRGLPKVTFYKVMLLEDRKMIDCVRYTMFYQIEDALRTSRDLIAVIDTLPTSKGKGKTRRRQGKKQNKNN